MSSTPEYSRRERILLSPAVDEKGELLNHVRIEAHSSLVFQSDASSSNSSNNANSSSRHTPLSHHVIELLDKYKALSITLQVRNLASLSFPNNALEHVPPLATTNNHSTTDGSNTSGWTRTALPVTTGPSGVFIAVELVGTTTTTTTPGKEAEQSFLELLQELVGRRILVAPLTQIDKRRLHRHVQQQTVASEIYGTDPVAAAAGGDGSNKGVGTVVQLSTILPMQGAPFAVEGLQAFTGDMSLSPCGASNTGVFGVADATDWSNLLLGVTTAGPSSVQLSATSPRGFWISFQSSRGCHAAVSNESKQCTLELSQGLHYTAEQSRDRQQQQQQRLGTTVSLSDLLPGNAKQLEACPFADSTVIETVAVTDQVSLGPACRPMGTNNNRVMPLSDKKTDLTQPCVIHNPSNQQGVVVVDDSQEAFWHANMHVLRPAGVANRGTLQSTVRNDHPTCAAQVSYVQTIPPVLRPRWQSLNVEWNQTTDDLLWTQLDENDIAFLPNGFVQLKFRHRLPAATSLSISLDYDPAFLSFEAIPGDANRGIELPPIQVHFHSECYARESAMLYSQSALLLPPLPDMSMPFNVLSLTCTLFAFVVGSLLNMLVRRGSESVKYQLDPDGKPASKLDKIKAKARFLKTKLFKRKVKVD